MVNVWFINKTVNHNSNINELIIIIIIIIMNIVVLLFNLITYTSYIRYKSWNKIIIKVEANVTHKNNIII